MPKVTKISFHIFVYLHKSMGDEAEFLPADKNKSFQQDDSITLGVPSHTSPKLRLILENKGMGAV